MKDRYGREIDYFRISVTDRCNLRCRYCMPEDIERIPMSGILSYEEIVSVAEAAAGLGISRIRLTGGEPLVRKGITSLIRMLKKIPGIDSVTMTTNGVLLKDSIDELLSAGLDGISISLDTLDPEKYRIITGKDCLDKALEGLEAALLKGLPVRINAVSVDWEKYLGVDEEKRASGIPENAGALIDLAKDKPLDIRFIELMPIGYGKSFPGLSHDILIPRVKECFEGIKKDGSRHGNGPAVYYRIPGFKGSVGFISAIHGIFCSGCNRIRLTSRGYLKSCLCYDTGVDVKEILRGGSADGNMEEALLNAVRECILLKPESHSFSDEDKISEKAAMSAIGG